MRDTSLTAQCPANPKPSVSTADCIFMLSALLHRSKDIRPKGRTVLHADRHVPVDAHGLPQLVRTVDSVVQFPLSCRWV